MSRCLPKWRGATVVILVVLAGCSAEKRGPVAKTPEAATATVAAALPSIDVTVVDKAGFAQALSAHRGKIVLVDYWATWCGPCVKQFPHTVELWNKYRDRGLDVIGLSFDEPSDVAAVQKFLAEKGATFDNLISKVGAQESSADEFDFDGALPHYVIFDRTGNLAKRLSPSDPTIPFRPDMIDAAVEELLATQPAP